MNLSDWGALAEVVSAIAVVVSLIYVGIQVHQHTRQLQFQGIEAGRKEFLSTLDANTGTQADALIFRRGLNAFGRLQANDQARFHSQMHALLHGFHSVWVLHQSGLLPADDFVPMRVLLVSLLKTPGGHEWWTSFKHVPPPHLVAELQLAMDDPNSDIAPATESLPWLSIADGE